MNAHTKQQQDKVFETDFIDSQQSDPHAIESIIIKMLLVVIIAVLLFEFVCSFSEAISSPNTILPLQ